MAEARALLWPLVFVVASTVVTATIYLSLLGAPLVLLSSIALGGVFDARRGTGLAVPRRSVVVWGIAAGISVAWSLVAVALAIVDRVTADIDDDVMTGVVAGGFLFALPTAALSTPAFVASGQSRSGRVAPSWPFVAGWSLTVIVFVGGVFCAGALFVDDPSAATGSAGIAMVAWSVAAAVTLGSGRTGD